MTSQTRRVRDPLPDQLAAQIDRLYIQMSGVTAKRSLWSRRFTATERDKCEKAGVCPEHNSNILDLWRVARGTKTFHESVIEVAHSLGYINAATRKRMLAELTEDGSRSTAPKPRSGSTPHWDHESRELRYRGHVVRTVSRPRQANNIVTILRAFEKAGWPPRIDDPFDRKPSDDTRRRDVHNLNNKLDRTLMFFACDGDGTGFLWKKAPRVKSKKAAKRPRRRSKRA